MIVPRSRAMLGAGHDAASACILVRSAVDDEIAFDLMAGVPVDELAAHLGCQLLAALLAAVGDGNVDLFFLQGEGDGAGDPAGAEDERLARRQRNLLIVGAERQMRSQRIEGGRGVGVGRAKAGLGRDERVGRPSRGRDFILLGRVLRRSE